VGILRLGEGFGGVTESSRDNVCRFARFQPQGCLGVSKIMEADTSKFCLFHDAIELLRDDIWIEGSTVGTCEYEFGFRPCWTCFKSIGDLSFSMASEVVDGDWVHVD
jgi:hypothetical protein